MAGFSTRNAQAPPLTWPDVVTDRAGSRDSGDRRNHLRGRRFLRTGPHPRPGSNPLRLAGHGPNLVRSPPRPRPGRGGPGRHRHPARPSCGWRERRHRATASSDTAAAKRGPAAGHPAESARGAWSAWSRRLCGGAAQACRGGRGAATHPGCGGSCLGAPPGADGRGVAPSVPMRPRVSGPARPSCGNASAPVRLCPPAAEVAASPVPCGRWRRAPGCGQPSCRCRPSARPACLRRSCMGRHGLGASGHPVGAGERAEPCVSPLPGFRLNGAVTSNPEADRPASVGAGSVLDPAPAGRTWLASRQPAPRTSPPTAARPPPAAPAPPSVSASIAAVCRRSSTSSFSKREMNHAAMLAVTTPSSAIPDSISPTASIRPSPVVGAWSPYPTVVIVVNDHHTASPSVLMFPSGDVPLHRQHRQRTEHQQPHHRAADIRRQP